MPLELMLDIVEKFSDPDDVVLDATCGSGSTGEACLRLGRRFIGIDKMEEHVATSIERLTASERGSSLQKSRAGQGVLFGGAR